MTVKNIVVEFPPIEGKENALADWPTDSLRENFIVYNTNLRDAVINGEDPETAAVWAHRAAQIRGEIRKRESEGWKEKAERVERMTGGQAQ